LTYAVTLGEAYGGGGCSLSSKARDLLQLQWAVGLQQQQPVFTVAADRCP